MRAVSHRKFPAPIRTRIWIARTSTLRDKYGRQIIYVPSIAGRKIEAWAPCAFYPCEIGEQHRINCPTANMHIVYEYRLHPLVRCLVTKDYIVTLTPRRPIVSLTLTESDLKQAISRRLVYNATVDRYYHKNDIRKLPHVWHNYQPPELP